MSVDIEFPPNQNKPDKTPTKVGNANLPAADIIRRGQAVLPRLECNLKWETDWRDLIRALGFGRDLALHTAETTKPQGPKYRAAIGAWLRAYGFDCIDKADRSQLIECFDHLDEIDRWRAKLPENQKVVTHPRVVLAHWKRSIRPPGSTDDDQKPPAAPADPYAPETLLKLSESERKRLLASLGIVAAEITQYDAQKRDAAEHQQKRALRFSEEVRFAVLTSEAPTRQVENIKALVAAYDEGTTRQVYVRDRMAPESHYRMIDAAKQSTSNSPGDTTKH